MEIHVVGHHEIAVGARVGGAFRLQDVARHLAQIEGRGEEVVAIVGAKDIAFVTGERALRRRPGLIERMHDLGAGALHATVFDHIVNLAEYRAIRRVPDAIAEPGLAEINERAGEDGLALGREGNFNRVVHAAGHDDVQARTVGARAIDVRGFVVQRAAVAELVGLLGERAFRPVNVTVRSEMWPVDIVGATRERVALPPFLALIGHAVAVRVAEPPDARRRRDVNPAVMPQATLREHHLLGEHDRLVEAAVAVGVFEPEHARRRILELVRWFVVGAGRVGHIQPAPVVEAGTDGALDAVGAGGEFDLEAVGDDEVLGGKFIGLGGVRGDDRQRDERTQSFSEMAFHKSGDAPSSKATRRKFASLSSGKPANPGREFAGNSPLPALPRSPKLAPHETSARFREADHRTATQA